MSNSNGSDYRALALISMAVGEMVAPIVIGVWIDRSWDTAPWGLVAGSLIGVVGGIAHLIILARREERRPPASQ